MATDGGQHLSCGWEQAQKGHNIQEQEGDSSDKRTRERYNWQTKREVAQRRMRRKMLEEERSWEEERIAVMCVGVGMSTGVDMRVGNVEAMMQHCQEEDLSLIHI